MTFLKKLGSIIAKGLQLAGQFEGLIPANVAQTYTIVKNELVQIAKVIIDVEVMGQALSLPGAQKLTAATPAVAQIILDSAILAHRKIADEALFKAGAQKIADGMADVLNSIKDDVQVIDKAA